MRALYQWQLADTEAPALIAQFTASRHRVVDKEHFAHVLSQALTTSEQLNAIIAAHAARSLEQLDEIGRAVLFVGLIELQSCNDIPVKVVINEAVELAKRYGAKDSYRFVNAVLDKASRELRA